VEVVVTARVLTVEELDANPWASCGPASLAALVGRSLAEIRHAFPRQREGRTWTNAEQMLAAVHDLAGAWQLTPPATTVIPLFDGTERTVPAHAWPRHGLVLIQWRGSWDAMPVSHPAQLQRTHWIATDGPSVFDVNLVGEDWAPGGWYPRAAWERVVVPVLTAPHKKATGEWWVRAGIEVS
jgi:hypothetical protein